MKPVKVCKEAAGDLNHEKRPATHPGPRCSTCHRKRKRDLSAVAHGRRISTTYSITPQEYAGLYALQGGKCYICVRSTGATKRLAVEHNHELAKLHDHPVEQGCRECITGLACGSCNRDVLGRLGHDSATYRRIANALDNPPAQQYFQNNETIEWSAPS